VALRVLGQRITSAEERSACANIELYRRSKWGKQVSQVDSEYGLESVVHYREYSRNSYIAALSAAVKVIPSI